MRLVERVLRAGVAEEREVAVGVGQGDALGVVVEDEEREFLRLQLARQHLPDAAVAADDGVVGDGIDVP